MPRLCKGASLVASEAVAAQLAKMRDELGDADAPPRERLLVRRVALCWLACHAAEIDRAAVLSGSPGELLKAADKRVDRAHGRLMTATKTLATVRKLVTPTLKLINPIPVATGPRSVRAG